MYILMLIPLMYTLYCCTAVYDMYQARVYISGFNV